MGDVNHKNRSMESEKVPVELVILKESKSGCATLRAMLITQNVHAGFADVIDC